MLLDDALISKDVPGRVITSQYLGLVVGFGQWLGERGFPRLGLVCGQVAGEKEPLWLGSG